MLKKNVFVAIFLLMIAFVGQAETFVIDATKNAIVHNEKGLFFMRLKYYPAAINEFMLAIALNPDSELSAVCYNNLAQTYLQIAYYDSAEKCFQRAIGLKPYNIIYTENLIKISAKLNKTNTLKQKYDKLMAKDKNELQPYLMLGLICKNQGDKICAREHLNEFVRLAPNLDVSDEVRTVIKGLK